MTSRSCCRICASTDLVRYLDLGVQPLANAYAVSPEESSPRYPLALNRCAGCGHSQLSVVVNPEEMFTNYLWVSGTTETQRRFFGELAAEALALTAPASRTPSVLDIGCNDGTLLDAFARLGYVTYGVDPARNLRPTTLAKGHHVLVDCWSPALAAAFRAQHGEVDLITACNVLAHCDDAVGFLRACHRVLAPGGRVIVEFPYALHTLEQHQFDQVYHEHVSYFLVAAFRRLCDAGGFDIVDVKELPLHGGSIRFTLTPSERRGHAPAIASLETAERARGLLDAAFYAAFSSRLEAQHRQFVSALDTCATLGCKVVAYGASAKANTMLNSWTDVSPAYVVDDNPLKCGHYTPGRHVPIVPASTLAAEPGRLAIVLTAWNYADEIARRLCTMGRRGDLLLTYVPAVRVETLA